MIGKKIAQLRSEIAPRLLKKRAASRKARIVAWAVAHDMVRIELAGTSSPRRYRTLTRAAMAPFLASSEYKGDNHA